MGCKYVILYEPKIENDIREGEKKTNAVAILLPSDTKNDQQAVRRWRKKRKELLPRVKKIHLIHLIHLCKILR